MVQILLLFLYGGRAAACLHDARQPLSGVWGQRDQLLVYTMHVNYSAGAGANRRSGATRGAATAARRRSHARPCQRMARQAGALCCLPAPLGVPPSGSIRIIDHPIYDNQWPVRVVRVGLLPLSPLGGGRSCGSTRWTSPTERVRGGGGDPPQRSDPHCGDGGRERARRRWASTQGHFVVSTVSLNCGRPPVSHSRSIIFCSALLPALPVSLLSNYSFNPFGRSISKSIDVGMPFPNTFPTITI